MVTAVRATAEGSAGLRLTPFVHPAAEDPGAAEEAGDRAVSRVRAALEQPCLFLSGSAPTVRDPRPHMPSDVRDHPPFTPWPQRSASYQQRREESKIRRAVSWLCQLALRRDYRLVFGGHPAISPLVLDVADRFAPPGDDCRVVIFQSAFFLSIIPAASRDIGRWSRGVMVVTDAVPNADEAEARRRSLTEMRDLMTRPTGLRAALFVGGMSGVLEESLLFRRNQDERPLYALASTGGAAAFLLDQEELVHGGRGGRLAHALRTERSYPSLLSRIVDDI